MSKIVIIREALTVKIMPHSEVVRTVDCLLERWPVAMRLPPFRCLSLVFPYHFRLIYEAAQSQHEHQRALLVSTTWRIGSGSALAETRRRRCCCPRAVAEAEIER